jgi:hypothetical protein
LWNKYLKWLSDIKLIQISVFSASYSMINPVCTLFCSVFTFERWLSFQRKNWGNFNLFYRKVLIVVWNDEDERGVE